MTARPPRCTAGELIKGLVISVELIAIKTGLETIEWPSVKGTRYQRPYLSYCRPLTETADETHSDVCDGVNGVEYVFAMPFNCKRASKFVWLCVCVCVCVCVRFGILYSRVRTKREPIARAAKEMETLKYFIAVMLLIVVCVCVCDIQFGCRE